MPSQLPLLAALEAACTLQHGSFVIAEADAERHYFAQFAVDKGEVWAEVVGNAYLEPPHQLSPEQEADMERRGWRMEAAGNWGRSYPGAEAESARRQAALSALEALAEVYGAQGELAVRASLEGPGAEAARARLAPLGVQTIEPRGVSPGVRLAVLLLAAGVALIALGLFFL